MKADRTSHSNGPSYLRAVVAVGVLAHRLGSSHSAGPSPMPPPQTVKRSKEPPARWQLSANQPPVSRTLQDWVLACLAISSSLLRRWLTYKRDDGQQRSSRLPWRAAGSADRARGPSRELAGAGTRTWTPPARPVAGDPAAGG